MVVQKVFCILNILAAAILISAENPCKIRATPDGSVCVCDSIYCDSVPPIANLGSGQYQFYSTSKSKLGFYSTTGTFSNPSSESTNAVTIDNLNNTFQTIIGFGGAFTDATGINIAKLPEAAQKLLLQSYFGNEGIQYSLGRVPIGGTDFSTRPYTYVDEKDESLDSFALQEEDLKYKIPFIQQAKALRGNEQLKLFGSAWSAPIWMKTNNAFNGTSTIKEEYLQLWAEYYVKFFEAYKQNNISFWGVTTQNEPSLGNFGLNVQGNGFNFTQMKKWIKHLGSTIRNSTFSNLKIMAHDDQRMFLPILKLFVLSDEEVVNYVDGIAVHWYSDWFTPSFFLNFAKSDKKELFRLATEACAGYMAKEGLESSVVLGSWHRADIYLNSIFTDLSYDFGGWVEWNMVLDLTGGPTWIDNNVDASILVNETSGEFYKQPMFYVQGHFSKFVVPDSIRVDANVSGNKIAALAFKRPDGTIAIVLRNSAPTDASVLVNILGSTELFTLTADSINTLLYHV